MPVHQEVEEIFGGIAVDAMEKEEVYGVLEKDEASLEHPVDGSGGVTGGNTWDNKSPVPELRIAAGGREHARMRIIRPTKNNCLR